MCTTCGRPDCAHLVRILAAIALTEACDACGAEPGEPCRVGCLGYAIEHDELAGTEPCS